MGARHGSASSWTAAHLTGRTAVSLCTSSPMPVIITCDGDMICRKVSAVHHADAAGPPAESWGLHCAGQCVDDPAGAETLPLHGAALRQCASKVANIISSSTRKWRGSAIRGCPTIRPCRGLPYAAQRVRGMVVFGIQGRPACWPAVHRKLGLFRISPTWAMPRTCSIRERAQVTRAAQREQQRDAGLPPELIRLSIGIEHIDDILEDLIVQALGEI